MEPYATAQTEVEDPADSRDSGVSMGSRQSACSQRSLVTAIHEVDLCGKKREELNMENEGYDHFDENALHPVIFYAESPIRKRQKLPTDFSFLHDIKNINNAACPPFSISAGHSVLGSSSSKSSEPNECQPVPFSLSHSAVHLSMSSLQTTITVNSSSHASSSTGTLLEHDDLLPPSVRSVYRAHSSSVLERSGDKSSGSPETLELYTLRTVERPQMANHAYRSIDAETLANLLESLDEEQFSKRFTLIDCRYPYEYEGGHIWFSKNVNKEDDIRDLFFPEAKQEFDEINARIPIFYCEFSQERGPKMALALRKHDRVRNEMHYPYVHYKEIYLLDRGYRHFFQEGQYIKYCTPQTYIRMWDPKFAEERIRYDSHRRGPKRKRSCMRRLHP